MMNFNVSKHIKKYIPFMKDILKDKRLRYYHHMIWISLFLWIIILNINNIYHYRWNKWIENLRFNDHNLANDRLSKNFFYTQKLTDADCLAYLKSFFKESQAPDLNVALLPPAYKEKFQIQPFKIFFNASFDYEIFDMIEYILSTPEKFGYTRLTEFQIEESLDPPSVIKGYLIYEQLR